MTENDIIDAYEKKRIRKPNEIFETNDIPMTVSGREYDDANDNTDSLSNENDIQVNSEEPNYETHPEDEDDDSNFRWNYKHINQDVDDLTKFSRRYKNTKNTNDGDKNLKGKWNIKKNEYLNLKKLIFKFEFLKHLYKTAIIGLKK